MKNQNIPRGIRNNNPLNIRYSAVRYAGKIPLEDRKPHGVPKELCSNGESGDPADNNVALQQSESAGVEREFEEFTEMRFGYLAALRLINRYMIQHNCYTLTKIISRWCPNSPAYIDFVCRQTGIGGNENLTILDPRLKDVLFWMATMENGRAFITDTHRQYILQAWEDYQSCVIYPPQPGSRINLKKFK